MNGLQAAGWICILASLACSFTAGADPARRGAVTIARYGIVLGAAGVVLAIAGLVVKHL